MYAIPAQQHAGQAEVLLRQCIDLYEAARTVPGALERQRQELDTGTHRVPEFGMGGGTATNIKGSVTRSRGNCLENRRLSAYSHSSINIRNPRSVRYYLPSRPKKHIFFWGVECTTLFFAPLFGGFL